MTIKYIVHCNQTIVLIQYVQSYWFIVYVTFEGSIVFPVYNLDKVIQQRQLALTQLNLRKYAYCYNLNRNQNRQNDLDLKYTTVESRLPNYFKNLFGHIETQQQFNG
ncbi:Hypothetical_protein [Hexamita inflata]|uniref:Hypothetical_protein n=1 Tax=Hexamita inflata TaxID=28002 RepID=A0AA86U401_9EUKA|nr:Hypothetical protein HINF_LOCUS29160 [Hexamita inflata]